MGSSGPGADHPWCAKGPLTKPFVACVEFGMCCRYAHSANVLSIFVPLCAIPKLTLPSEWGESIPGATSQCPGWWENHSPGTRYTRPWDYHTLSLRIYLPVWGWTPCLNGANLSWGYLDWAIAQDPWGPEVTPSTAHFSTPSITDRPLAKRVITPILTTSFC